MKIYKSLHSCHIKWFYFSRLILFSFLMLVISCTSDETYTSPNETNEEISVTKFSINEWNSNISRNFNPVHIETYSGNIYSELVNTAGTNNGDDCSFSVSFSNRNGDGEVCIVNSCDNQLCLKFDVEFTDGKSFVNQKVSVKNGVTCVHYYNKTIESITSMSIISGECPK